MVVWATDPLDQRARAAMERCRMGDEAGFEELHCLYHRLLYAYFRMALSDAHEAEDLTQQVFMRMHGALPGLEWRGDKPVRAWVFVIARNLLRNEVQRRARVEVHAPEFVDARREAADYDQLSALWLRDSKLAEAVGRLPVAQRQVVVLRFLADLGTAEIAAALDRSPDDVRQLKSRALSALNGVMASTPASGALVRRRMSMWIRLRPLPVLGERRFALWSRGRSAAFARP
jgi:RNA polymerase sigma-70 factor (ECF subfamily)